jgi:hypothetical protein
MSKGPTLPAVLEDRRRQIDAFEAERADAATSP